MTHEAQFHEANSFLTLTYDDYNLPFGGSLRKEDFQKFMKRLRKKIGSPLKVFYCGEYGDQLGRPHYHAILFGEDFARDREYYSRIGGNNYFVSERLSSLWNLGHSIIGPVTFESCAYTASYCTKKVTGPKAKDHYEKVDPETGEIYELLPEFSHQSNGIGARWLEKFRTDIWSGRDDDFVVMSNGVKAKPPRFYYEKFRELELRDAQRVKGSRYALARANAYDNTKERLAAKEKVALAQFGQKERSYERGSFG